MAIDIRPLEQAEKKVMQRRKNTDAEKRNGEDAFCLVEGGRPSKNRRKNSCFRRTSKDADIFRGKRGIDVLTRLPLLGIVERDREMSKYNKKKNSNYVRKNAVTLRNSSTTMSCMASTSSLNNSNGRGEVQEGIKMATKKKLSPWEGSGGAGNTP